METKMENVEIRFARKGENKSLEKLSRTFAAEKCCNNIIADSAEYFAKKDVVVAVTGGKTIGYCYGAILKEDNKRSYAEPGDLYYELEEVFVLKEFRSQGVGAALFEFAREFAKQNGCKTVRLNAVSKDYKRLLNFYIDILGMDFISAYLIKKIDWLG